jgi:hypothetical protein
MQLPVTVAARPTSRGRIHQKSATSSHCSMQYYCGSVKVKAHFFPSRQLLHFPAALHAGERHTFVGSRSVGPIEEPAKLTRNWY